MKKGSFISIIITSIIIFLLIFYFVIYPYTWGDKSWGEDGELSITLSTNENTMDINDSLNITQTMKNNGSSKIRVITPFMSQIKLYDSNNSLVEWVGPWVDPPGPPTNDNLKVLKPGESFSFIHIITTELWDLIQNETYRCIVHYYMGKQSMVTLPYWKGEIWSNGVYFNVV